MKDSAGKAYAPSVWQALYMKGGYELKPENPNDQNTSFLLVSLSEKEKEARMERMPKPRESNYFKTGKKINLFTATDINGNKIDLNETAGKIIVINFWFTNCGPCRREIPELNKLVDSFTTNEKILFIGVALDNKDDLQRFLKQFPFNYTIIDDGRGIATQYGVKLYPTHLILDQEGKVYFHTSGLAPNTVYWIKKSINELLQKTNKQIAAQ